MRRTSVLLVAAVLVLILAVASAMYFRTNSDPNVASIASKYGIHPVASFGTSRVRVPDEEMFATRPVGLIRDLSIEAGYDPEPYGGQVVTVHHYLLLDFHQGHPLMLRTWTLDGKVVAAWVGVTGWSTLVPGAFSLPEIANENR